MIQKDLLKRLDELISRVRTVAWIKGEAPSLNAACSAWDRKWNELRNEIESERCKNCAFWDSDPSSAPDVKIPEKTYARVCFVLTMQDVFDGDFRSNGAVITTGTFGCSHFEKRGS